MGGLSEHNRRTLEGLARYDGPHSLSAGNLQKIIAPTAGSAKQVLAYNLCDGQTPQAEIGKKAKLDPGSLSRSIAKWIDAGVVIRIGADEHPLHLYPLIDFKPAKKAA